MYGARLVAPAKPGDDAGEMAGTSASGNTGNAGNTGNSGQTVAVSSGKDLGLGLGIADLLTPHLLASSLRWARSALQACPCMDGCPSCSPPWAVELRAKQSALRMMGR